MAKFNFYSFIPRHRVKLNKMYGDILLNQKEISTKFKFLVAVTTKNGPILV
jgi:hypothetical protein